MGLTESLEFVLNANPTSAIQGFQQVASASDRSLTQVESNVAKIGKSMLKLGGAGIGVGGLLTQIASGDEQAAGQLKASIEAAGQTYSDFSEKIDKAVQSQVRFGHTDEQTNQALATLVGSFGDTNKALDEMQLVTDLAARKNISLGEAATIVAKAHGGAGRVFKEFNITVATGANGLKDYDGALGQLADKLKGQAAAGADTATGRFKALKAEVENVASEIGQRFGPTLLVLSTGLTAAGGAATALGAIQDKLAASHAAAALAAEAQTVAEGEAAAAEALVATNSAAAVSGLYAQAGASTVLEASMGPVGLAVAGLSAAFAVFGIAQRGQSQITADYTQALRDQGNQLDANVDKVTADALAHSSAARSAHDAGLDYALLFKTVRSGTDDFGKYVDMLNSDLPSTGAALRQAGAGSTEFGQKLLELSGHLSRTQIRNLVNDVESLHNQFVSDSGTADAYAAAIATLGPAADSSAARIKQLTDDAKTLQDQINAVADAGHQLLDANLRAQAAPIDLADSQQRAADAKAKLGTGTTAAENAQFQRDYDRALIDVTRSANNLAQAQVDLQTQTDKANGITDDANTQNSNLEAALQNVANMLTGQYATAVQSEIDGLDAVNKRVALQIDQQDELNRKRLEASGVTFSDAPEGSHSGYKITAHASGGPLGPNQLSTVNEAGLEMFSMGGRDYLLTGPQGGYVHNAQETSQAMSGGGFTQHNQITVVATDSGAGVRRGLDDAAWRARSVAA